MVDLEEEKPMPPRATATVSTSGATPIRTPAKRRLGLGGPRLGGQQSPSKRLRLGPLSQTPKTNETPKLTRAVSSASSTSSVFHGWKDVDLIVRSVVEEEDDDDDLLNEGFRHYSIINDDE